MGRKQLSAEKCVDRTAFLRGGAADIGARILAQGLTEKLGHQVIVENRPGGAGNIAYSSVAHAEPDGYEVLVSYIANSACAHAMMQGLTWKANDFQPVAMYTSTPLVFVANSKVPANTMPEFLNYLKTNPGAVNYGTWGIGSFVLLWSKPSCRPMAPR